MVVPFRRLLVFSVVCVAAVWALTCPFARAAAPTAKAPLAKPAVAKPVAAKPSVAAPPVAQPAAPAETDIALAIAGGVIEKISAEAGPGFQGRLLIDGKPESVFRVPEARLPLEIVSSFFNRQPALISKVSFKLAGRGNGGPKQVEVWTSTQGPDRGFHRVAQASLKDNEPNPALSFSPTEAAFVKTRVLSTQKGSGLELGALQVIEAKRAGYRPLATRFPELANWRTSARYVAQRGIDWLEPAAADWQRRNKCFGCHSQAQVVMGLAIADRNHYVVDRETMNSLVTFMEKAQHPNGTFHSANFATATQFAAMAFSFNDELSQKRTPALEKATEWLVSQQKPSGELAVDMTEPPLAQGSLTTTANMALAFDQVARKGGAEKYREALRRALDFVASGSAVTNQDEVSQVLSLTRFGSPERRRVVNALVARLLKEQNPDGGWQEGRDSKGSNALATGQALYALKAAGVSVESAEFVRGVNYLVSNQKEDGAWPAVNSHSKRPSEFAPTMWAVIGLAGSFRESKTGTLQVVSELEANTNPKKASQQNILIVLDESGSMKARLGKSTRIATARTVIRDLLGMMPAEFKVGLRMYGHRAKPSTKETCTDTEVVLPIAPIDHGKFMDVVNKAEPRGDTPLVYATLKTSEDLKPFGGGSVILITDGEESCGGNLDEAAKTLKASGVDLTLDIVGFTIEGKKTEASLGALAAATGGHYYPASDGDALQRALATATFRYPYTVLDKAGHSVAKGTADSAPIDLKPGEYQVIVYAGGKELKREQVTVKAAEDVALHLRANGENIAFVD